MAKFYSITLILLLSITFMGIAKAQSADIDLPNGFVYLNEVDPSIIIAMKYAGDENFIGSKIDGYVEPVAILTKEAAEALKKVQKELGAHGYSLVVYDAYRPNKAVQHFVRWATTADNSKKAEFYPYLEKSQIIPSGYVSARSAHSRGSTVDLSIISLNTMLKPVVITNRTLLDGTIIPYHDDGTLDMGSSFDLFDELSHHDSKKNDPDLNTRRNFLKEIMVKNGFVPYTKEWWHYTLAAEPFPDQYFDFDVK